MGFPQACVALPREADDDTIAALCREWTARLMSWLEQARAGGTPGQPRYDGTVLSACRIYQRHPHSPFHAVKANTRRTYTDSLTLIERTVGKRLMRNLTIFDVQHWYAEWRKPAAVDRPERIDRAHNAVAMFRTVVNFCAKLKPRPRFADCVALAEDLRGVRFEKGGAREGELTYAHVTAFLRTADELGRRSAIPKARALAMAIGVAAQFELLLRQKDIIGERPKTPADLTKALERGATAIACPDGTWVGYFTWENIPGWRWRTKTSKSKYRAAADFDLARQTLLLPLLERVPLAERTGAVIKGEGGYPIQERSYRKWFRQIARAAGIPDQVYNMDSRGGATEADQAGADIELIREGLTHANAATTARYLKRRGAKLDALADARRKKRAADSEPTPAAVREHTP